MPKGLFLKPVTVLKGHITSDFIPSPVILWKVDRLRKEYKKCQVCIAMLLKACNKIWASMLIKSP